MKRSSIAAVAALVMACGMAQGAVLVNETFASGGTIATYTGAGKTFDGSVATGNALGTVAGGQLSFGIVGSTSTDTDLMQAHIAFPAAEALVSVKVDVTGVQYGAAGGAFGLWFGDFPTFASFDRGWNTGGGRNFGGLTINDAPSVNALVSSGPAITTGLTISQTNTWSLFFNASASTQSFTAPDLSTQSLNAGCYTAYIGTSLFGANIAAGTGTTGSQTAGVLTGIYIQSVRNWGGGNTNTSLGNLVVRDDLNMFSVPEPASLSLLGLGGLALLGRRRR